GLAVGTVAGVAPPLTASRTLLPALLRLGRTRPQTTPWRRVRPGRPPPDAPPRRGGRRPPPAPLRPRGGVDTPPPTVGAAARRGVGGAAGAAGVAAAGAQPPRAALRLRGEPAHPAPAGAGGDRGGRVPRRAGAAGRGHATRLPRRRQLPEGHLDPPGLRPA